MGGWVTREVTVQEYGWVVRMRDATLRELTSLKAAGSDMEAILATLSCLVQSWNIVGADGKELPVSAESLHDIPNQVIAELIQPVFKRAAGISDPKGGSGSTLTMQPKPEEDSPAKPL